MQNPGKLSALSFPGFIGSLPGSLPGPIPGSILHESSLLSSLWMQMLRFQLFICYFRKVLSRGVEVTDESFKRAKRIIAAESAATCL